MPRAFASSSATQPATGASLAILALLASCRSPRPPVPLSVVDRHAGDMTIATHAFTGVPVLQKSFFWDGNGEVDDSGVAVQVHRYLSHDFAVGVGTNFATWWAPGRNIHSFETEGRVRLYPFENLPLFVDGSGGFQLADDQIPPGGTVWNFTFSFGPGFDVPLAERTRLQFGSYYHHISNALGRENARNPSQNEVRFWLGVSFVF